MTPSETRGFEPFVRVALRAQRPAFEGGVTIRVEEVPLPRRQLHAAVAAAVAQQAAVDLVGVVVQDVAESFAVPRVVGRLEAAEPFMEGGQDLLERGTWRGPRSRRAGR